MQAWALIVDGFRESRDRKIFWVMLAISLLVTAALACIGFSSGQIDILFGLWTIDAEVFFIAGQLSSGRIARMLVDGVLDLVVGFFGVMLAIIATAGSIPTFLQSGTIDVTLAKPIARWRLFLGRYLASLIFILVHATIFIVLTFLVAGLRWGVWLPGYLAAIPLMVILFSYLYCISALVGVYYRSAAAAVLLTIGAWVMFFGAQTLDDAFRLYPRLQEYPRFRQMATVGRWIVPKTQDITYLAQRWVGASGIDEIVSAEQAHDPELIERGAEVEARRMQMPAYQTIGSSLLFEAVILVLAIRKFSRSDF